MRAPYITATSSATSATMPRSWVITITVVPNSLLQVLDQLEDLRLDGHVERRRRLVGDEQVRRIDERHGDHHALTHAARQLVRIRVDAAFSRRDADALEHVDNFALGLLGVHLAVRAHRLDDLVANPVERVQARHRVLEDHGQLVAPQSPASRAPTGPSSSMLLSQISPVTFAVLRSSRPITACAVTLLPEPDSPTIASVLPFSSLNETSSTAWTRPSSVGKATLRLLTVRKALSSVRGRRDPIYGSGHPTDHPTLTRGSTTAYRRSTTKFAKMMNAALTRVTPAMIGRSERDDGVDGQRAHARAD